jgi:hypothetical protein
MGSPFLSVAVATILLESVLSTNESETLASSKVSSSCAKAMLKLDNNRMTQEIFKIDINGSVLIFIF